MPRIINEALRALDGELAVLNRAPLTDKLRLSRKPAQKVDAPPGGWTIDILENTDEETQPGDIVIYSELAMPSKPEYGAGSMTKLCERNSSAAFLGSELLDDCARSLS